MRLYKQDNPDNNGLNNRVKERVEKMRLNELKEEFAKTRKKVVGGGKTVYWGCGNTAEIYWEDYSKDGLHPDYWIDNNELKQQNGYKGYQVYAPSKLLQEADEYCIVIFANVPSSYKAIEKEALSYSERVCSAEALYYCHHQDEVLAVIDRLDNDHSRDIYISMLLNRMRGEFNSDELISHRDYFPTYPFTKYSSDEVYVDLGAFKGDTLENYMFIKYGILNKYYAFEPVEENYNALNIRKERLVREWAVKPEQIICEQKGVGKTAGTIELSWENSVGAGTSLDGQHSQQIPVVTLDEYFSTEKISVIKADIEGMEMDMLEGAKQVIRRDRPLLAICIYHKLSDLINIPDFVYNLEMGYHIDIRCHSEYFAETVMYAW